MIGRRPLPLRTASVLIALASLSVGAQAQSAPPPVTNVSLPQAGAPMVIVPEAEPAQPERRGFGLLSPFRRKEARPAAPLPIVPVPESDATPSAETPEAQATADSPVRAVAVPLPRTRPAQPAAPVALAEAPVVAVAAEAEPVPQAQAQALEITAQPGVPVEIANERALDQAAAQAATAEAARKALPSAQDGPVETADAVVQPAAEPEAATVATSEPAENSTPVAVADVPVPRVKPVVTVAAQDVAPEAVAADLFAVGEPDASGDPAIAVVEERGVAADATDHGEAHPADAAETHDVAASHASGETELVAAVVPDESQAEADAHPADLGAETPADGHESQAAAADATAHGGGEEHAAPAEHAPEPAASEDAHPAEHAAAQPEAHAADEGPADAGHSEPASTSTHEPAAHDQTAAAEHASSEAAADAPASETADEPAHDEPAHAAEGEDAQAAAGDGHGSDTGHKDGGPDDGSRGDGHGEEHAPAAPIEQAPRLAQPADSGSALAPPYQLVRTLQALQDDIAHGSTGALTAQKVLLSRMDDDLLAADPAVWQEKRNAEALVVYTLSGGRPAVTRELLEHDPLPNVDERLLRGALAYVQGREEDASKYLEEVDPLALAINLAGQVALAKSTLVVGKDPDAAIRLLDQARLLSPGTLIEEAALRREIYIVSERNDIDKFEFLSRQYLRRFQHSVYAGNFRQRFAAAITRMSFVDDPIQFQRLHLLLADLDADSQRELYLLVARAAVNNGKTAVAAMASERALADAAPGSRDQARALLYRGAALAVMPEGLQSAIDDLRGVDRALLAPSDAALYDAASATADLILTAPDGTAVVEATSEETQDTVAESEVVARATTMVDEVDALLSEVK